MRANGVGHEACVMKRPLRVVAFLVQERDLIRFGLSFRWCPLLVIEILVQLLLVIIGCSIFEQVRNIYISKCEGLFFFEVARILPCSTSVMCL